LRFYEAGALGAANEMFGFYKQLRIAAQRIFEIKS
jgi:hypothetical protein